MTIAQVGEKYGLTPDTLRYYEKIGLIPPVERSPGGIRNYSEEDCRWVQFIRCMRNAGLPIDVLTDYMELFRQGHHTAHKRKDILLAQREILLQKIAQQQEIVGRLDHKIMLCEKEIEQQEE